MHRGLQALINSRKPSGISTGYMGNQFSDVTQEMMQQNRSRLWALGPAHSAAWQEHEILYNQWIPFYGSPIHEADPDGMTAPQREVWFREQAVKWSSQITTWEPHTTPQNTDGNVGYGVAIGIALGVGVAIAAAYGVTK